jgi:hypothetical protein
MNPLLFTVAITVGSVLAGLFLWPRRRAAIEAGRSPLHEVVTAGAIGWIHYRGPFIRVRTYDRFVVISGLRTIVLGYDAIDAVEARPGDGILLGSVRILHHQPGAPRHIRFDLRQPERLWSEISALRIKSKTGPKRPSAPPSVHQGAVWHA